MIELDFFFTNRVSNNVSENENAVLRECAAVIGECAAVLRECAAVIRLFREFYF